MPKSARVTVIFIFFAVVFFLVLARLGYWQLFQAEALAQAAKEQHFSSQALMAHRGLILARDLAPLAANQEAYTLEASLPDLSLSPASLAFQLAPILAEAGCSDSICPSEAQVIKEKELELATRLQREGAIWLTLEKNISRARFETVSDLQLEGLHFSRGEERTYPEGTSSAHLLGFVGRDEQDIPQGYFGLEGWYDRELKGRGGLLIQERDALGRPIIFGATEEKEKKIDGRTLITSIDRTVQLLITEGLERGLERYQAASGTVTVMDPNSGEILGMVSLPGYDPAQYAQTPPEAYSNPVVSSTYEPGSTFKVVVMAAALDDGAVDLETRCDRCDGPRTIGEYQIETSEKKYFPGSSLTEIIVHSDNVGMVFVGEQMPFDHLYRYLQKFGFGDKTGIDIQGEESAPLRPISQWFPIDQAALTFGQGAAITRLQLLRAVAAIGNGGWLVKPHVGTGILTPHGVEYFDQPPKERVIQSETARLVSEMMVAAVEQGHAKRHRVAGFSVAGKTGTAQIAVEGHYDEEKTIASFIGFAPSAQPRFIMLVTLREPTTSSWGSETAAPIWFEIAKELFLYYGISPE